MKQNVIDTFSDLTYNWQGYRPSAGRPEPALQVQIQASVILVRKSQ